MMDIALCDLRYASSSTAGEASAASSYVENARAAVRWFWNNLGALRTDEHGVATGGLICRILALPGHVNEAVESLRWLAETIGTQVSVSVMSQYTPVYKALEKAPWNRKVYEEEYELLRIAVDEFGFDNGWVQEFEGDAPAGLLGQTMSAGEGAVGKSCV
jgi:putative pyruvate formate lyase activating enzyme